MSGTRLNISLSGFDIGLSGAVPGRENWSEPAMDRAILEFVGLPLQSCSQPKVIENARTQLGRDAADHLDRGVNVGRKRPGFLQFTDGFGVHPFLRVRFSPMDVAKVKPKIGIQFARLVYLFDGLIVVEFGQLRAVAADGAEFPGHNAGDVFEFVEF